VVLREGQGEDKPADGEEELHAVGAEVKSVADEITGGCGTFLRHPEVEEAREVYVIRDHPDDGQESKTINLRNVRTADRGDAGKRPGKLHADNWDSYNKSPLVWQRKAGVRGFLYIGSVAAGYSLCRIRSRHPSKHRTALIQDQRSHRNVG
jgi:hypothetical protein